MSDIEARLACASSFILQSPPGEVNDVFNDVRALVGDDEALEAGILPALQKYNVEQLIVADLPDRQQLMVCSSGSVLDETNRFIEPSTAKAWLFDHLRLTASDPVDIQVDADCEAIRADLEKAASRYGQEHFTEGVSKVFTSEQRMLKPKAKPKKQSPSAATAATSSKEEVEKKPEAPAQTADTDMQDDTNAGLPSEESKIDTELVDPETAPPTDEGMTTDAAEPVEPTSENDAQDKDETIDTDMAEEKAADAGEPSQDSTLEAEKTAEDLQQEGGETSANTDSVSEPRATAQPEEQDAEVEEESTVEPLARKFSLYFVGNKYNPSNYWTGRWRSSYKLDLSSGQPKLRGTIQINVHLFEQGNVQLATNFAPTIPLSDSLNASSAPADIAKAVIKGIAKVEEEYQLELNEAYRDMADRTFRNLRRVLPITRQKMDWAKVASYKIGKTLSGE